MAVNGFHAPDIRRAELRQGYVRIALDRAGHTRCPQQLVIQMPVNELMDIAQILQQLPTLEEWRGYQLDQGFGKIRRDVIVGERRTQRKRMPRLDDFAGRRNTQRFFLDALAAPAQHGSFAGIDEPREPALEFLVDHVTQHRNPKRTQSSASRLGYLNLASIFLKVTRCRPASTPVRIAV